MNKVLQVLGGFVLGVAAIVYRYYVATKIWTLTLVPYGVPNINMYQALAIGFAIGIFTMDTSVQRENENVFKNVIISVVATTFYWGFTWLVFA